MKAFFCLLVITGIMSLYNHTGAQVAVYSGGNGDGHATVIDWSVYKGGGGDGYAMQQTDVPLPIHLLSFHVARYNDQSVLIEWSAETDALHHRFELERSFNGMNYGVISVKENADSNTIAKVLHRVIDRNAVAEAPAVPGKIHIYYRLRSVDKDGSFTYSPVKRVVFDPLGNTLVRRIYPNPGNGTIYVEVNASTLIVYQLFDGHGKVVAHGNFTGNTILHFNYLASGLYWLRAESNGKQETIRVDIVR